MSSSKPWSQKTAGIYTAYIRPLNDGGYTNLSSEETSSLSKGFTVKAVQACPPPPPNFAILIGNFEVKNET